MRPIWTAVLAFVLTFLARFISEILIGVGFAASTPDVPAERLFLSLSYLLAATAVGSVIVIVGALIAAGRPPRERLRLVAPAAPPLALLVMIVGTLALGQAMESLAAALGVLSGSTVEFLTQLLVGASGTGLVLAVIVIGGLGPVGEELFFRGFMQTRLQQRWRPAMAVVAAALAFGAVHLDWVHGTMAFGYGLYFGFLTVASGSVLPAILAHMLNNTASVVLTASIGPLGSSSGSHVAIFAGAAALFVLSLVVLRRLLPSRPPVQGERSSPA